MLKKIVLVSIIILTTVLTSALFTIGAFAGSNNANGNNGMQGTDILNGKQGCNVAAGAGDYWVYVPSDLIDQLVGSSIPYFHEWKGGPCCVSNTMSGVGNNYPIANQCCNGPDYLPEAMGGYPTGEQSPGNHCRCFEIRGYPYILFQ